MARCTKSFLSYRQYQNHFNKKHSYVQSTNNNEAFETADSEIEVSDILSCRNFRSSTIVAEALFLLRLMTVHHLGTGALEDVLKETQHLLQNKLQTIRKAANSESVDKICNAIEQSFFKGFLVVRSSDAYFTKHFGFVKPVKVILGYRTVRKKLGKSFQTMEKPVKVYYVPFLQQLAAVLNLPEVYKLIRSSNGTTSPSFMKNIKDGNFCSSSLFLAEHPNALLFGLYCDDFEIVNAIGVHRKIHKITAYYWTILNIPILFRSKLQSINLLAIAKNVDLKHFDGYKMLLKDLLTSLQKLVVGVTIKVDNVEKTFFGILICGFGDTPAAQALGGFKEGVGASLSPCRTCNISRQHISTVLLHKQCLCRTSEEHLYRVQCLENMSDADRFHWSKLWGINKRSILMNIPHFDVTSCILHDPMHVLLEGICKVEVKNMLYYYVYIKKVFTLAQLNNRINFFEYSSVQMADKPQIIEKKHLQQSATFPQTAASMLILLTSLPFMLFDFDPYLDEHWTNFVHLLQIVLLCTSSEVSSETIYELQHLISSYISVFLKLYPNSSFSPKMHYLIHFPDQI